MRPLSYQEIDSLSVHKSEIVPLLDKPIYRKATPNMVLASYACEKILSQHPLIDRSQISFVLGTAFGEVETSLSYLNTLEDQGLSRPNLFQNSLHNSTLGFVSILLNLKGPAITVSAGNDTLDSTHLTAHSLLALSEFVLECVIDLVPHSLEPYYNEVFPSITDNLNHAQCWLWTRKGNP